MIDINNIKEYAIERPEGLTCLGTAEDFDNISDEFKDQIIFINEAAADYLYGDLKSANFITGSLWEPFKESNFKSVEKLMEVDDEKKLKKWLYERGIPFSKWVFLLPNYGHGPMTLTWKMVVKNARSIFWSDDIILFDETNQWCLCYWHEEEMFYGSMNRF